MHSLKQVHEKIMTDSICALGEPLKISPEPIPWYYTVVGLLGILTGAMCILTLIGVLTFVVAGCLGKSCCVCFRYSILNNI